MKQLCLFGLLFFFCSCSTLQSTYYNTNKKKKFTTLEDYTEYISKKYHLNPDKILLLSNDDLSDLGSDIRRKKLSTYYGIAYNEKVISAENLDNKTCSGQIEILYKNIGTTTDTMIRSSLKDIHYFDTLKFKPSKKTLIFLYSYKIGRLSKFNIAEVIQDLKDDPDFDYYIISMDNADILSK